jgi:pilus assembly protein CpaB
MGRGRIFIYLGLIIILGLVAVVVLGTRLPGILGGGGGEQVPEATPIPPVPEITVIGTTQRIPRGAEITDEVITEFTIPQELSVESMITNRADVLGKRAKFNLESGVPLFVNDLSETLEDLSDVGSVAAFLIPRGMVAVSIPVNRLSSVAFGVERGDHVNVIVTLPFVDIDAEYQSELPNSTSSVIAPGPSLLLTVEGEGQIDSTFVTDELLQNVAAQSATGGNTSPQGRVELDPNLNQPFYIVPSEPQRPRLVSQAVIQDAIVLQLGTFLLPGEEDPLLAVEEEPTEVPPEEQQQAQQQPVEEEDTGPEPPDIVTLIVSPQDAVTLNYLIYSGAQLSLAMRAFNDDTLVDIEAVTLQFLLDEYNIPVPAKLPFGTQPRIEEIVPPVLTNDIQPTEEP